MGNKKLKKRNTPNYVEPIVGILVFLVSFFTYLKTLTPSIPLHDAGELVTCAYLLGIPHPPGYPIYCLLGKFILTILPLGNIAYRMNLFSAVCGALTCMMVYFITLKVRSGKWKVESKKGNRNFSLLTSHFSLIIPAVVAALTLAFATTFWEQTVIAEKYALNTLFTTLLIFILLKWAETQSVELKAHHSPRTTHHLLYLFVFTLGLSFTHHFQTIFLIPAGIFFIIAGLRKKKEGKGKKLLSPPSLLSTFSSILHTPRSGLYALCFLLPFSLYLYLPLRAIFHPMVNMGDPRTLKRFLEHIQTTQFGGYFETSLADFFHRFYTYTTQFFPNQFTVYLILPGLIGAFFLFKHSRRIWTFLFLVLVANILHSLFYNIPNIQDHYLPAFIVFAIWIGSGVQCLLRLHHNKLWCCSQWWSYSLLLLPVIPLITHYHHNDRSQYYFATDLVRNILTPMEDKPIIFLETDDTAFPLWYIHYVEKTMPRAILIDVPFLAVHYDWYARGLPQKYPDLDFSFKFQDMLGIKSKELEKIRQERISNIISNNIDSHPIYKLYDSSLAHSYSLIPQGLFCRVLSQDISPEAFLDQNKRFLIRGLLDKGILDERTQELIARYPQTYYNIGCFYFQIKQYDQAIEKFKQALELDPKYLHARHGLESVRRVKQVL